MSKSTYAPPPRKQVAYKPHFGSLLKALFAATPMAIFLAAVRTPEKPRPGQSSCDPRVLAGCIGGSATSGLFTMNHHPRQRLR